MNGGVIGIVLNFRVKKFAQNVLSNNQLLIFLQPIKHQQKIGHISNGPNPIWSKMIIARNENKLYQNHVRINRYLSLESWSGSKVISMSRTISLEIGEEYPDPNVFKTCPKISSTGPCPKCLENIFVKSKEHLKLNYFDNLQKTIKLPI